MRHIKTYNEAAGKGPRMFEWGDEMHQAKGDQAVDDFTPGEADRIVRAVAEALPEGSDGVVEEIWSGVSDSDTRYLSSGPIREWRALSGEPVNNLHFKLGPPGYPKMIHHIGPYLQVWKTTDDYYWVELGWERNFLCDGLAQALDVIRDLVKSMHA